MILDLSDDEALSLSSVLSALLFALSSPVDADFPLETRPVLLSASEFADLHVISTRLPDVQ